MKKVPEIMLFRSIFKEAFWFPVAAYNYRSDTFVEVYRF